MLNQLIINKYDR